MPALAGTSRKEIVDFMRKLVIMAALSVAALGGVAACTTAPTNTPSSSAPVTSAPADDTVAVCAEATSYAATASANVLAKYNEGAQALAANDLAKAQEAATAGKQLLGDWSTKFKELSGKSIRPEVKTAIDNMVTFVDETANAATADPATVQAKFAELSTALTTACADK